MAKNDRLVVVTYDAGTGKFTVNPNPVAIPQGTHKLYFALQTVNKGHSEEATLTEIVLRPRQDCDKAVPLVTPLNEFPQIFVTELTNDGKDELRYDYSLQCHYDEGPRPVDLDPTIILQPAGG